MFNAFLIYGYGVITRLRWQLPFQIKFYLAYIYLRLNLYYMRSEAVNNRLVDDITLEASIPPQILPNYICGV